LAKASSRCRTASGAPPTVSSPSTQRAVSAVTAALKIFGGTAGRACNFPPKRHSCPSCVSTSSAPSASMRSTNSRRRTWRSKLEGRGHP
jgi:hypothetical protein